MYEKIFLFIKEKAGIPEIFQFIILGCIIIYFNNYISNKFILNLIITTFVVAFFDIYLKNIILFAVNNNYYKFIINNIITIVMIDLLFSLIKEQNLSEITFIKYFNIGFACLFYETIIFKFFNYNSLCNGKLRTITKTIIRLATIHILSNFLNDKDYDIEWFDFSTSQIFNFSLFNIAFTD